MTTADEYLMGRKEIRSERDLLAYVTSLADSKGLCWFHSYDSMRDRQKGFPDLVLVGTRTLFRELKGPDTLVSPEQKHWGERLRATGADWAVWRPEDYYQGRVDQEIQGLL